MIAALISVLSDAWPALLAGLVAIASLLFGWGRHKQAQTTEAQAKQKEAEADAKVAQIQKSEAEANAAAAREGGAAVKERTDAENRIAAGPSGESSRILRDDWSRD